MHSAGILRAFEIDAKTNAFAQLLNAFIVKGIVSKGKSGIKAGLAAFAAFGNTESPAIARSCSCVSLVRSR